jgi:electron transfer flavoprotein alpha subunit
MGQGIWVLEEHDGNGTKNITLELLNEGKKVASRFREPLCGCLIGSIAEENIDKMARYGAEQIFVIENEGLSEFNLDSYSSIIVKLITEYSPSIVMMGATPAGSELAPRVAAKLNVPCITDVKKIAGGKDNLKITKSVYSDMAYADIQPSPQWPLIITISPGETDVVQSRDKKEPIIIKKTFRLSPEISRTRNKRFIKGDPKTISLVEADRIIAGGKAAGKSGFQALQKLADILGASIGGSRKAVDDGFLSKERQIGISGNTVTPRLLIACGISGAREFTTGMENADLVIAVNTDDKSRIFEFANLRIKGDLHQIIPALTEKIFLNESLRHDTEQ